MYISLSHIFVLSYLCLKHFSCMLHQIISSYQNCLTFRNERAFFCCCSFWFVTHLYFKLLTLHQSFFFVHGCIQQRSLIFSFETLQVFKEPIILNNVQTALITWSRLSPHSDYVGVFLLFLIMLQNTFSFAVQESYYTFRTKMCL